MGGFSGEGTPATNPHDNSVGTNVDKSLRRKNAQDTDDNAADFESGDPDPQSTSSAPGP